MQIYNPEEEEILELEVKCQALDKQIDSIDKSKKGFRDTLFWLLSEKTKSLKRIEILKKREAENEIKAKKSNKKLIISRSRNF